MVTAAIVPPSQWYDLAYEYVRRAGWPPGIVDVIAALLKVAAVLGFITLNVLFLIWLERKVSAWIQNRLGPMRTGPYGLLQTLADALKLLTKEDIIPAGADRWVFALAPFVTFTPALLVYVVVPFGERLVVQDLNIGILFVAAMTSAVVPSFLMAGWGSNNKWSVFAALRTAAQLVSYEVPLVLAAVAVVMLAGSLSLGDIVEAQRKGPWFIFLQPLGFLVYYTAALAEANRAPFDLIEAESELVAGFNVEYSGMRWALFFLAEYANLLSGSAIAATLYLGGWSGPWLPPFVWLMIKTYALIFLAMWIRWTVPRIRVDQLMSLGWKVLVPLGLVNLALTGIYVLVR